MLIFPTFRKTSVSIWIFCILAMLLLYCANIQSSHFRLASFPRMRLKWLLFEPRSLGTRLRMRLAFDLPDSKWIAWQWVEVNKMEPPTRVRSKCSIETLGNMKELLKLLMLSVQTLWSFRRCWVSLRLLCACPSFSPWIMIKGERMIYLFNEVSYKVCGD